MSTVEIVVATVYWLFAWVAMGWLATDTVGDKLKGRSIYAHMAVFAFGAIVMALYIFYALFWGCFLIALAVCSAWCWCKEKIKGNEIQT